MSKLTNILNGILGAGANRRITAETSLKTSQGAIWEVRRKHVDTTAKTRARRQHRSS